MTIMAAIERGDIEQVRRLLSTVTNDLNMILQMTFQRCIPIPAEIVRLLLEAGASPNAHRVITLASANADFDVVKLLLDAGADPTPLQWTPLMRAIVAGSFDDVVKMLVHKPDFATRDHCGRTPWLLCLHAGDLEKAKLLYEQESIDLDDSDQQGQMALLYYAVAKDNVVLVKWLIDIGADPYSTDFQGETLLMMAAQRGAVNCVRFLVEAGVDVHARDERHSSAINYAANIGVIRALVEAGADINNVDGSGYTPLKHAVEEGDVGQVKALLELGASPHEMHSGQTALQIAVHKDNLEIVNMLLKAGADPNVGNWDAEIPLFSARSAAIVKSLLKAGADYRSKDWLGTSVLDHYRARVRWGTADAAEMLELLEQWSASPKGRHLRKGRKQ